MLRPKLRIHSFAPWVAVLALFWVGSVLAGDQASTTFTRKERQALWSKNIELLEKGRSSVVETLLRELPADKLHGDPRVKEWLTEYRETYDFLEKERIKDYDSYVERAQKDLKEGLVREALHWANRALANTLEHEAFLKSEWLTDLTEAAVKKAGEYRVKGEWRKAHSVYYDLSTLFEDRKDFKRMRRECLTHARLNYLYEKDGQWKEIIEDVLTSDVTDALDRIDRYYVERADFKEIATAGLEQLVLLTESRVMRETFETLADEDLREDFAKRLKVHLEQLERRPRVTAKEAQQRFQRALTINATTVRLPESLIAYEFMVGALDPLDDFTSIIWPVEFREFDKHTRGDFVGVGISITGGGHLPITVVSPLEDTPAYRADIRADDQITHVDGQELKNVSLSKAVEMITGPIDTDVTLTIYRDSEKRSFDKRLTRKLVKIISVKGIDRDEDDPQQWDSMIDEDMGIAYIRVGTFQENTVDQLRNKIYDVLDQGAHGLILDLRFNPGGLLKSAVEMAQLFLSRDEHPVVSTRGLRDAPWENPRPATDGPFTALPLIVLVNEYSASASEIVSGALKDHKRAIIIGDRTFGKFSVQKLMRLGGGESHLKLTTARYYLPSGQSLHHEEGATEWGVMPEVKVRRVPKELDRILTMRRDRDVLSRTKTKDAEVAASDNDARGEGETTSAKSDDDKTDKSATADARDNESKSDDTVAAGDEAASTDGEDEVEDKLQLEPDENELPDVDLVLDTATLLMRLHLLGENTLQLAALEETKGVSDNVRNP